MPTPISPRMEGWPIFCINSAASLAQPSSVARARNIVITSCGLKCCTAPLSATDGIGYESNCAGYLRTRGNTVFLSSEMAQVLSEGDHVKRRRKHEAKIVCGSWDDAVG